MSVFSIIDFVHSQSQALKKEKDCGRLMVSIIFSLFIMTVNYKFKLRCPILSDMLHQIPDAVKSGQYLARVFL